MGIFFFSIPKNQICFRKFANIFVLLIAKKKIWNKNFVDFFSDQKMGKSVFDLVKEKVLNLILSALLACKKVKEDITPWRRIPSGF